MSEPVNEVAIDIERFGPPRVIDAAARTVKVTIERDDLGEDSIEALRWLYANRGLADRPGGTLATAMSMAIQDTAFFLDEHRKGSDVMVGKLWRNRDKFFPETWVEGVRLFTDIPRRPHFQFRIPQRISQLFRRHP